MDVKGFKVIEELKGITSFGSISKLKEFEAVGFDLSDAKKSASKPRSWCKSETESQAQKDTNSSAQKGWFCRLSCWSGILPKALAHTVRQKHQLLRAHRFLQHREKEALAWVVPSKCRTKPLTRFLHHLARHNLLDFCLLLRAHTIAGWKIGLEQVHMGVGADFLLYLGDKFVLPKRINPLFAR